MPGFRESVLPLIRPDHVKVSPDGRQLAITLPAAPDYDIDEPEKVKVKEVLEYLETKGLIRLASGQSVSNISIDQEYVTIRVSYHSCFISYSSADRSFVERLCLRQSH